MNKVYSILVILVFGLFSILTGQRKDSLFLFDGFAVPSVLIQRTIPNDDLILQKLNEVPNIFADKVDINALENSQEHTLNFIRRIITLSDKSLALYKKEDYKSSYNYAAYGYNALIIGIEKKIFRYHITLSATLESHIDERLVGVFLKRMAGALFKQGKKKKAARYINKAKAFYLAYQQHLLDIYKTPPAIDSIKFNQYYFSKNSTVKKNLLSNLALDFGFESPTTKMQKMQSYLGLSMRLLPMVIAEFEQHATLYKDKNQALLDSTITYSWLLNDIILEINNDKLLKRHITSYPKNHHAHFQDTESYWQFTMELLLKNNYKNLVLNDFIWSFS